MLDLDHQAKNNQNAQKSRRMDDLCVRVYSIGVLSVMLIAAVSVCLRGIWEVL